MKFLNHSLLALLFIALIFPLCLQAQQFKWVRGGGTTYDFTSTGSSSWEQVKYICTDPNGNIYALSQVGNNPIHADTFYRGSAYGSTRNLLLTSYNCNGQMRWAKLLGSSADGSYPIGIIADSFGHVYVAAYIPNGTAYIGYDTSISGLVNESSAVIQFDTDGHFNWIRDVGDNTFPTIAGTGFFGCSLALDGTNNIHFISYIKSGVHITPSVATIYGTYDLVYNPSGTLLSSVRLDLDSEWTVRQAIIDPVTNKMYVCGEININIYGGFLTDTFYAAAFDASRNRLWMNFVNYGGYADINSLVMDTHKNLIFCGGASGSPARFVYNGDSASASWTGASAVLLKVDTNGAPKWIRHYDCHLSVNGFNGTTLLPNDKVATSGGYAGVVYYEGYNPVDSTQISSGQDAYVVIVDSAGDVQKMQSIPGDGFYDGATAITSDKAGNIYIGGEVEDTIIKGVGIPAYHSVGGNSDFFVVKYGMDCSCTGIPISAYIDTGTYTIGFTYTGTTSGIDSVVWTFDDGHSATGATAIHTYTAPGTYRACATVYTDCGNDIYCTNVPVAPSLAAPGLSVSEIKIFPNPATDELNVSGVQENMDYRLLSVTGTCVSQGALLPGSNAIPMHSISPGIYILEMVSESGQRDIVRVVKN